MFNIDQILKSLQTDQNTQRAAMTGVAGLAAGALLGGGGLGGLVRVGALAAIGGLAYKAWESSQTGAGGPAPDREVFVPADAAAQEELGKSLVRAMIAAAKADGRIDADEKDRIFKRLETMPLSAEEKAFVFDELSSPLDLDAVAASATSPERATEIYAASLVAMSPDTPAEQDYLGRLATRLGLAPGLVAEIHRAAAAPLDGAGQNAPANSSV